MKPQTSISLSLQQSAEILGAMIRLSTSAAHLSSMTPEQRCQLPRLGARRESFSRLAIEAARENPQWIPSGLNIPSLIERLTLHGGLGDTREALRKLLEQVEDTQHALGANLFDHALEIYRVLKARRRNRPLEETIQELKTRLRSPRVTRSEKASTASAEVH